jgi:hypothetical protein
VQNSNVLINDNGDIGSGGLYDWGGIPDSRTLTLVKMSLNNNGHNTQWNGNAYHAGTNWRYISDGKAVNFNMYSNGGNFLFRSAPSGTAGDIITWGASTNIDSDGIFTLSSSTQYRPQVTVDSAHTSNAGGYVNFRKARGTVSSKTNLENGDKLGTFMGQGYFDGNFINSAYFDFTVDGTPTSTGVPSRITFNTTNQSGVLGERLRIDNNGNTSLTGELTVPSIKETTAYKKYYTKGAGTSGIDSSILYPLFPAANDTLTLGVGTYKISMNFYFIVNGSTVSASVELNMKGAGTAVGNISATSRGNASSGGNAIQYFFNSSIATTVNVTSTTSVDSRVYSVNVEGMIDITTAGTIIPSYQFSATLTGGTVALSAGNHMVVEKISNSTTTNIGWV